MNRIDLTKVFLKQWNVSTDDANVKFYSRKWWKDNRATNSSCRLTEEGRDFLVNTLQIKAYEIPFTESIDSSPQTVIYLARFIDSPFFLTNHSITVFSEIKSFELHLFSDDIRKYGIIKSLNARIEKLNNNN
jgi:hypothetical protein